MVFCTANLRPVRPRQYEQARKLRVWEQHDGRRAGIDLGPEPLWNSELELAYPVVWEAEMNGIRPVGRQIFQRRLSRAGSFSARLPRHCSPAPASPIAVRARRRSPHSSSKSAPARRARRAARPFRKRSVRSCITSRRQRTSSTLKRSATKKPTPRSRPLARRTPPATHPPATRRSPRQSGFTTSVNEIARNEGPFAFPQ